MAHRPSTCIYWLRFFESLLLLLSLVFGFARSARADSDIVLIDYSDKAYTVYAGVPASRAADVRRKLANQPADVVTIEEFSANQDKYIALKVLKDEYPDQRAVEGIVALVRMYPNTPFGITWNGGIAYTRTDYQFAKVRFELFNKDPEKYQPVPPEGDSVAPRNHLKPLLGW
jgi:hypothetical protein